MSFDGKTATKTGADTAQPVTSERPPRPDPIGSSGVGDTPRPPRLRNLSALLLRENVDFVIVLAGAEKVRVGATLADGGQDSKTFDVGADGCYVILRLSDNPAGVGPGFHEIRPPTPVSTETPES